MSVILDGIFSMHVSVVISKGKQSGLNFYAGTTLKYLILGKQ